MERFIDIFGFGEINFVYTQCNWYVFLLWNCVCDGCHVESSFEKNLVNIPFVKKVIMRVLVLSRYGRVGASSRLRTLQFLPLLQSAGIFSETQPFFSDELLLAKYRMGRYQLGSLLHAYMMRVRQLLQRHQFDLVWIEKEALPWLPAWFEQGLLRGVPYVLDYDDALFHNYDLHSSAWVRRLLGRRIDRLMAGACLVVGGNNYLARRARDAGAPWVEVVPTVIDLERYAVKSPTGEQNAVPRIVWIGSPSTVHYLTGLAGPLAALNRRVPFKLRVIGGELQMAGVDVECVRWTEESEAESIAQCDVGIMPLLDSLWERGKCGYKLIQYMACGLPVVASNVGVNSEIVRHGENGYLASTSGDWVAALETLLQSPSQRAQWGAQGRHRVEEAYCIQKTGPLMAQLLRTAAGKF